MNPGPAVSAAIIGAVADAAPPVSSEEVCQLAITAASARERGSLSGQIDDLIEAAHPDQMTQAARRLRSTALIAWRLLLHPLPPQIFPGPGISCPDPGRARLHLADQAVNTVTALDYLLTLLSAPPSTPPRLILSAEPGADRLQDRADEQARDRLTRRRLDARATAVREGTRLLVMLRQDITTSPEDDQ